jgi:hypothetical protein
MQILRDSALLMVEPAGAPTDPIIDDLTRRITAAWRARRPSKRSYRGRHNCTGRLCLAVSDHFDHQIGRRRTNSLCIHYVACHRGDLPAAELAKVAELPAGGDVEPTAEELSAPRRRGTARPSGQ